MVIYFALDIIIIIASFLIINHKRSLTFYHPGAILLLFHISSNTFRFYSLMNGADISFSEYRRIEGASIDELSRALFLADIALLSCSIAIAVAENIRLSKPDKKTPIPINQALLNAILFFTIPLGIIGAVTQLYIPTVDFRLIDSDARSNGFSLVTISSTWFGLSMLALIYFRGFKLKYIIPLFFYLIIVSIQGGNRYRFVLPLLFLLITYLYYHKLKWPKPTQFAYLVLLFFLTIPLKEIGRLIQEGGSITDVSTIFSESFKSTSGGNSGDQGFLDQYAMTLTEIDKHNKVYYGTTIAPLILLPIPRSMWDEKPALNQWQIDISTINRPFDKMGSIGTIYGEAYANFRVFGVVLIPATLFYFLTIWYRKIKNKNIFDLDKFLYTIIFVCLIQVLRDGLISLFIFPILNNMPLVLIYILHRFVNQPKKKQLKRNEKNNFNRRLTPSI